MKDYTTEAQKTICNIVTNSKDYVEEYVKYSNQLSVECDCGDDEEYILYLQEVCRTLCNLICIKTVSNNGYYIDDDDEWHRWKRKEE